MTGNMGIEVDVKKKFVVNGREYASPDDLPADIREALQKILKEDKSRVEVNIDTSIVFNGKEYKGIDEMPSETRQAYERVMKAVGTGDFSTHALGEISGSVSGKPSRPAFAKPITAGPSFTVSFSPKTLVVGIFFLAVILGLYFLAT